MATPAIAVGKSTPRSLRFTARGDFQKTLNERVNAFLRDNRIPARDVPAMYLKSVFALAWWLATYLLMLLGHFSPGVNIVLCLVWGLAIACVGFNVVHDANHNAYSNRPWVNKLVSLSAELIGMSGFRWRTKHDVWHHTYTNIAGYDDDLETFGVMRLTPRLPWKPLYRAQAWYYPLVYSFIGFDFILRDFAMAIVGRTDANHIYPRMGAADQVTFWIGKLFFVLVMFVLPMQVYPWWQVVLGFILAIGFSGILMGVIFQLAHINGDSLYVEPTGNPPHVEKEWAVQQVEATSDFAPHNWLINFYTGGLNYQVEHHLFPHICHLNYPRLAPIVQATCQEFGLPYHCFSTWRLAMAAHVSQLRTLGQKS